MALIKCTECGKEISDSATLCPHCGCSTEFGRVTKQAKNITIGYLVDVGVHIFGSILFWPSFVTLNQNADQFQKWMEQTDDGSWIIIKVALGLGLMIGSLIHLVKLVRSSNKLKKSLTPDAPKEVFPVEDDNTLVEIDAIPENKQCYGRFGKCELCDARGATALCQIENQPGDYELCIDCINKYMAKIK